MSPKSIFRSLARGQEAQILPWTALLMGLFLGISGLVVDVGRGEIAHQELVDSTNAAAMAAGAMLPASNYGCVGLQFSSSSNSNNASTNSNACGSGTASVYTGVNQHPDLQNVTTTVSARCSTTVSGAGWNVPCQAIGGTGANVNAVVVTQTAQIPTFFAGVMGIHKLNISATAAAAAPGVGAKSWNVAIIVDTTASMNTGDSNCGSVPGVSGTPSRLQCALYGVQILLSNLDPCPQTYSSCSSSPSTSVRTSLWTFPSPVASVSVSSGTAPSINPVTDDTNCSGTNPTIEPYTFPSSTPTSSNYSQGQYITSTTTGSGSSKKTVTTTYNMTYAVTTSGSSGSYAPSYLADYRTSDTTTSLNGSSTIVDASGGKSGCAEVQAPGGESTYYAGVLYGAQASLLQEQASLKSSGISSQNAIIILSDGDAEAGQGNMVSSSQTCSGCSYATSGGTYPSWTDECQQAVTAAETIAGQGTRIYSIAYGSESSGCNTDSGDGLLPCTTMKELASSYWATPSSDQYFYADANQSGSGIDTACLSSTNNTTTNLKSIFLAITSSLGTSRLIPYSLYSN